jgi:hypothetical protein
MLVLEAHMVPRGVGGAFTSIFRMVVYDMVVGFTARYTAPSSMLMGASLEFLDKLAVVGSYIYYASR